MREVSQLLAEQGMEIELTVQAQKFIAQQGYDPQYGARPVKRAIQRLITNPLSEKLLAGDFTGGDQIIVDCQEAEGKGKAIIFKKKP